MIICFRKGVLWHWFASVKECCGICLLPYRSLVALVCFHKERFWVWSVFTKDIFETGFFVFTMKGYETGLFPARKVGRIICFHKGLFYFLATECGEAGLFSTGNVVRLV